MKEALLEAHQAHGDSFPVVVLSGEKYQIRNLRQVGRVWKGSFAHLRDDAPHVASPAGVERELALDEDEHVIEKCFFLYREQSNVLVWQVNRQAGGLSRFAQYLSQVFDEVVTLPMVMNEAEMERVLNGDVYQVDFAYDRPQSLTNGVPQWNQNAFDMMSRVDAAHAKFSLRAARRGSLLATVKTMLRELIPTDGVAKLRVKLTDETDPIELFMAPLKDTIRVALYGRYPRSSDVYAELESAFTRNTASIPRL